MKCGKEGHTLIVKKYLKQIGHWCLEEIMRVKRQFILEKFEE